jgi:hypothetical protein
MSKRTALIAAGIVLAAGGGVTAVAGGTTLAIAGTDGTLSTGRHAPTSETAALVSDRADLDDLARCPRRAPVVGAVSHRLKPGCLPGCRTRR